MSSTEPTAAARSRIILLGTGAGPVMKKLRSQPAALLVVDGHAYLIDAGNGVVRQLAWAGFRASDVDAVFVTHHHFDHTADLGAFMAFAWASQRGAPVDIVGPPGTAELVKAGLAYFSISERIFARQLPFAAPMADLFAASDVEAGDEPVAVYRNEHMRVLAVANSHYATMPRGAGKSYSYRFELPDRIVVFTGDTGPSDAVARLAEGADMLVSEVIDLPATLRFLPERMKRPAEALDPMFAHMRNEHLSPEEVGKLATRAQVKMVVLTHFVLGRDEDTDSSTYTAGVQRHYSGPVVAGKDLSEF